MDNIFLSLACPQMSFLQCKPKELTSTSLSVLKIKNFIKFIFQIDVWAAGIILYILLCGFPPFVSVDNQQEPLFDAILSGIYEFPEPYWNDIGDGVRDLIANMLQSDPDLRFSSEDILDHHWTVAAESDYS